ncbi:MAG: adenosylcobalamin-dependent ribonucleoside-diphosphate reductase [DPANN group archaeon]|nr:adenosylcobalamin-dependent ribonucleoside-diphosphate reductase [DPANN group archaeon]
MAISRSTIRFVRKRDGRLENFQPQKIVRAAEKAFLDVKRKDGRAAAKLADEVIKQLEKDFPGRVPGVEYIQNLVEKTLIKNNLADVAKAYILYRQKHAEQREIKTFFGVKDDLKLGINAIEVLRRRYLLKNNEGKIMETPSQMFRRVAHAVAKADKLYKKSDKEVKDSEEKFYNMMASREFMPNSPTLMNAGTPLGQLSACFVIPVEDSLPSIFDAAKAQAIIQQSGGGTGFSFSRLRPEGDVVHSTHGIASGPVTFMRVFDTTTDVIKQGGKRRGANMGILHCTHPDIVKFITAKRDASFLKNFNISVAATEEFMQAVLKNKEYNLVNPRTKKPVAKANAKQIFDLICNNAWETGDPGLIFIDEINASNPLPEQIESTNPCGEQPLLPWESCNLGSINLSKFVEGRKINFGKLQKAVGLAVHFLDNVIDANKYPLPEIEKLTKANRRIGLGVMGFAEMLIRMGIPYDSEYAVKAAEKLMEFISDEAHEASAKLAKERGDFPNFKRSKLSKTYKKLRNVAATTIAPTGTISIIAGCSSGIEPLFAVSFVRNVLEGTQLIETNSEFEEIAKQKGFYSRELMLEIAKRGSIQGMGDIPADIRRLFVTALDIKPEWHVKMQAAFQKFTDNAVSKTINLPHTAAVEDVRKAYLLAHKLNCKGITVYRYGSKPEQVLTIGPIEKKEHVTAEAEFAGGHCGPHGCSV